jgi:alkanesulfonate monooxygenase SsuD/methylene tetrahydromethanopterin reductase-like flavin-dependent oxidoreductase (luciferase family)
MFEHAYILSLPVQSSCFPHPEPLPSVLIASFQPRMMRLVARYADWWNTGAGIDTLEKARAQKQQGLSPR